MIQKIGALLKQHSRWIVLLLLMVLIFTIGFEWAVRPAFYPIRKSTKLISADLLQYTPTGSTREEVLKFVDSKDWPHGGKIQSLNQDQVIQRVVGEYSSFGFKVIVFAEWLFDENDRLISIEVYKWIANAL